MCPVSTFCTSLTSPKAPFPITLSGSKSSTPRRERFKRRNSVSLAACWLRFSSRAPSVSALSWKSKRWKISCLYPFTHSYLYHVHSLDTLGLTSPADLLPLSEWLKDFIKPRFADFPLWSGFFTYALAPFLTNINSVHRTYTFYTDPKFTLSRFRLFFPLFVIKRFYKRNPSWRKFIILYFFYCKWNVIIILTFIKEKLISVNPKRRQRVSHWSIPLKWTFKNMSCRGHICMYEYVPNSSLLECSPPTTEARFRFSLGTSSLGLRWPWSRLFIGY